jgi:hypothetical protein
VGRFSPVARYATVFSREITERVGHLSATYEPISFEQHIKPLFRERDRQSMKCAFAFAHMPTSPGTATPYWNASAKARCPAMAPG